MSDLVGRARREGLLAGDGQLVGRDVVVVEVGDALLAADPGAIGVGDGLADRVLDDDVVGHQRQPAVPVVGLHAPPRGLRRGQSRRLGCLGHRYFSAYRSAYLSASVYRITPRMFLPSSMSW